MADAVLHGWARRVHLASRAFHYFSDGRSLCRNTHVDPMSLIPAPGRESIICAECRELAKTYTPPATRWSAGAVVPPPVPEEHRRPFDEERATPFERERTMLEGLNRFFTKRAIDRGRALQVARERGIKEARDEAVGVAPAALPIVGPPARFQCGKCQHAWTSRIATKPARCPDCSSALVHDA